MPHECPTFTQHFECRDKLSHGREPATVVRYIAALSRAFAVAVKEWGWMQENPLNKVEKPELPRGRVRFLSDDERARLLN
jgi:site-specific recombinase XerD